MPSIAIISNSAFSVVNFRSRLIKDILARGWDVYALAPDFNEKLRTRLKTTGAVPVDIKMARTGLNPAGDIFSLFKLIRTLRSIAPEMTFSYGIKPVIYGLIASKRAGVPNRYAMVAGLGTLYVDAGRRLSFKNRLLRKTADLLYRYSFRSADNVFFQNPDDLRLFTGGGLLDPDKTVLLNGSGVDTDHYQTDSFHTNPITFTLASRLIREKGIHEFVKSAEILRAKYPEQKLRFVLLGDIDLNPNSIDRETLNGWVEEKMVVWPGHVDDVKTWLEKTSVFVLPSYYREGTPKSILEAMAMSRPVVTTDTPGCRETVKEGMNGFFVPPKDPEALARVLEKFVQNPLLIEKMGKESRKIAVEKFDVKEVNRKILRTMAIESD